MEGTDETLEAKRNREQHSLNGCDESLEKDCNKNRLREQDIHKIVDTFNGQNNLPKYARFVPLTEIKENEYNLNIPRYIDTQEEEEIQDLTAHLQGGIPARDIYALKTTGKYILI